MTPGEELVQLMRRAGWERAQLAHRLDTSTSTVGDWMTDRRPVDDRVLPWMRLVAAAIETAPELPAGWTKLSAGRRPQARTAS